MNNMPENNTDHSGLFSQYGKQFQETIFQGLISDHGWASQMTEVMSPDYFEIKALSYLAEKYFAYHRKYKCFPTLGLLVSIIKEELTATNDTVLGRYSL